jgi:hypothetical protein
MLGHGFLIPWIQEITAGETACSVWTGVNTELFRSSIGITDDAARKIAETEFVKAIVVYVG